VLALVACCSSPPQPRSATRAGAGPIDEASYIRIGGIEQWVTIRGVDRTNPILLVIHGGPGDAQSALRNTYAIYEKSFTLVQWDQPGAGKTYAKNRAVAPDPDRVERDAIELSQYLLHHLGHQKLVLLGHSWGSHLGIDIVRRRPDLFSTYVGTGQVGSWREAIQVQFDFLLSHARAAGDRATVEKLEAIGKSDPTDANTYFSWWSIRNPYMAASDLAWINSLMTGTLLKTEPAITGLPAQTRSLSRPRPGRGPSMIGRLAGWSRTTDSLRANCSPGASRTRVKRRTNA